MGAAGGLGEYPYPHPAIALSVAMGDAGLLHNPDFIASQVTEGPYTIFFFAVSLLSLALWGVSDTKTHFVLCVPFELIVPAPF